MICKILGNYAAMCIRCISLCVYDSWNLIKTEFTIQGLVVSPWDGGSKISKITSKCTPFKICVESNLIE